MQSFHRSRGRIFFEVLCAFAVSASCVGAWMQTGATALLLAAAVAALYGLVHAFDMAGRRSAAVVAPQPTRSAVEAKPTLPVEQPQAVGERVVEDRPEPAAPRPTKARRTKSAPKAARRPAKARDEKVAQPAPAEEPQMTELAPPEEQVVTAPAPRPEPQVVKLTPPEAVPPAPPPVRDDTPPLPLTPLFEPAPFVRQQRGAFGRKAG